MNSKKFNQEMFSFINKGTCSFTTIKEIKKILIDNGFLELDEARIWNLENDKKYFVIRSDASLIAFSLGRKTNFNITVTHVDTPAFVIKPECELKESNYLKLDVVPYGGLLDYAWLDEELSIAGRVIIKSKKGLRKQIIDLKRPLLCIPSVAIHQNDKANECLNLNPQKDLLPIIALNTKENTFLNFLSKSLSLKKDEEISDYDLFLYATSKPTYLGINKEMILAPRIDDLTCVYSALKGFLDASNKDNNIFCAFNSEEIGSLTKEGADSTFLMDVLNRIINKKENLLNMLADSTILCADNTHATHPNHPGNSDVLNEAFLNKGVVISKDIDSATNSVTSAIFKSLCRKENIPIQYYVTKNDLTSGSTLSTINLRHVSIDSIDIGLSELAMHGAKEIIGSMDAYYLYQAIKVYYEAEIIRNGDIIELK